MEKTKVDRINELARKSRAEGLTEAEAAEQADLRAEYIEDVAKIYTYAKAIGEPVVPSQITYSV